MDVLFVKSFGALKGLGSSFSLPMEDSLWAGSGNRVSEAPGERGVLETKSENW